MQKEVKSPIQYGFLLDIFGFLLIIPVYSLINLKEQDDVGNNSAKEQSQAEEGPGLQKKNEHRDRPGSDQPPSGQGQKASRGVTNTRGTRCRTHTEKASG